jgi:hypothetical protein
MIRNKLITIIAATAMVAMIQTAQATIVVPAGSALWTSIHSGQTINVDYQVDLVGGLYYYEYQVEVPAGPGNEPIESLEIDATHAAVFLGVPPVGADIPHGASLPVSGAVLGASAGLLNVHWNLTPIVPGTESLVLAYTSTFAPIWGNGSAIDDGNGPWSSQNPGSAVVPVPVPEPTTMIAGALLLLPFGASTLRVLRRRKA